MPAESYYRANYGIQTATIVKCLDCGLVHTNPVLQQELDYAQYRDLASGYNQRVATNPDEVIWTDQLTSFHEIRQHLSLNASILDVGCGEGGFVHLCQKAGFQAAGLEINEAAVLRAGSLGIKNIRQGLLADLEDGSLDCVAALHVLEHLADCRTFADQFARVLRPGGMALVAVPNYGSLAFRRHPIRYWNAPYQHMNGFSSHALDDLLLAVGFERVPLRARWTNLRSLGTRTVISMTATRILGNTFGFFPTKLLALYKKVSEPVGRDCDEGKMHLGAISEDHSSQLKPGRPQ